MKRISFKTLSVCLLVMVSCYLVSALVLGKDSGYVAVKQTPLVEEIVALFDKYTAVQSERVYLQTDKPLYAPGETIWFQAYVADNKDMKASGTSDVVHVQLIN